MARLKCNKTNYVGFGKEEPSRKLVSLRKCFNNHLLFSFLLCFSKNNKSCHQKTETIWYDIKKKSKTK